MGLDVSPETFSSLQPYRPMLPHPEALLSPQRHLDVIGKAGVEVE